LVSVRREGAGKDSVSALGRGPLEQRENRGEKQEFTEAKDQRGEEGRIEHPLEEDDSVLFI
jgi:hypothetical protein